MSAFEIKKQITNVIYEATKEYGISVDQIFLEHPEVESFGDYFCNVAMRLSKSLKRSPMSIAEEIKDNLYRLQTTDYKLIVDKVDVVKPGFINFWIKKEALLETIKTPYEFAHTGKKIMVEYSAPNPNKPLHLGHARNNALGMAMGGILKFLGNEVIFANWINNRGVAICKAMWGYLYVNSKLKGQSSKFDWRTEIDNWFENKEKWQQPNKKSDHYVMDFYVEAEKAEKEDENVKKEFLEMLAMWEHGDEKVRELWKMIVGWAYEGWKETYKKQNCLFDKWYFESDFYLEGKEIIQKKLDEKVFYKDENGTIKANLEKYNLPDKVLIRSDGTSIYITPDLALAKHKFRDFNLDKSIYVVGADQELYFKQLFSILDILGFASVSACHHLAYGMVNLTTGKMSTREGTVVLLDDVISDLTKKLEERNSDEMISEQIAICAINYMMLKSGTKQEISFDPIKSVEIQGNTGPYLQYTLVRTKSIQNKIHPRPPFGGTGSGGDPGLDSRFHGNDKIGELNNEEVSLIRTLYQFPEVVQIAAENYAPNLLCNFLYDLAQKFNLFYAKHRIIDEDKTNEFRLFLTQKTGEVLESGMKILNLPVVEKM